jgi:hypothetical protein
MRTPLGVLAAKLVSVGVMTKKRTLVHFTRLRLYASDSLAFRRANPLVRSADAANHRQAPQQHHHHHDQTSQRS